MVRSISGQGITPLSFLPARQTAELDTTPSPRDLLGNNKLVGDLEKHLDDVQKGKGYLSKGVNKEILQKQFGAGSDLSTIDPSLSRLYNGLSTGLTYSKNARFVSGVSQSVNTTKRLLDLYS